MTRDDDLIRRGDVMEAFCNHSEVIMHNGKPSFAVNYPNVVRSIPAVPREMTAREYLYQRNRFIKSEGLAPLMALDIDECVAAVEQWAAEHPERRRKTYAEDFIDKHPHARVRTKEDSLPVVCRDSVYGECKCHKEGCVVCWNELMLEEDEDEKADC